MGTAVEHNPRITESVVQMCHFPLCCRLRPGPDADVDAAAHHIADMFSACNNRLEQPVFYHFTTATDTSNIQVALQMVIAQIIKENLAAVQLL